jgi:NDP-sugar pyrophosphorylase family protein
MTNTYLNIVIPMAGRGSRFASAGYKLPKPLIPIHGIPMIRVVVGNIRPKCRHRFIFLCLREHIEVNAIDRILSEISPDSLLIPVDEITPGAACTVLLAEDFIDNGNPMMIANSDQWVDYDINDFLGAMQGDVDGLIMTMRANDPKWSYVRTDDRGSVIEVVEKKVVSNEATVGIYNFRRGRDYVRAARSMIAKDARVNGEFYVAPVYNELIGEGKKVAICNIGSDSKGMYGMGTPSDLDSFTMDPISFKAGEKARK